MSLDSKAKTGFGITITGAGIASGTEIIDVTPPSVSRADIKTSHAGTTGAHTFIPADLIEGGQLTFDVVFTGARPTLAAGQTPTSYVITFKSGGPTWTFDGYINSFAPKAPIEDRMTGTIGIKVAGEIEVS